MASNMAGLFNTTSGESCAVIPVILPFGQLGRPFLASYWRLWTRYRMSGVHKRFVTIAARNVFTFPLFARQFARLSVTCERSTLLSCTGDCKKRTPRPQNVLGTGFRRYTVICHLEVNGGPVEKCI